MPCTIVLPETTPAFTAHKLRDLVGTRIVSADSIVWAGHSLRVSGHSLRVSEAVRHLLGTCIVSAGCRHCLGWYSTGWQCDCVFTACVKV